MIVQTVTKYFLIEQAIQVLFSKVEQIFLDSHIPFDTDFVKHKLYSIFHHGKSLGEYAFLYQGRFVESKQRFLVFFLADGSISEEVFVIHEHQFPDYRVFPV